jgi:TonB family protein
MSQHADILDERESPIRRAFMGSLALHVGIVAVLGGTSWWAAHNQMQMGTPNSLGGAIGISVEDKIHLPNRSVTPNPVAADTTSSVPQKPEKVEKKKAPVEDPDAIPLNRNKLKKPSQETAQVRKFQPVEPRPNQVYNTQGMAVNSPMYGQQGIGGVGIGDSTVAGHGCGGYLELVRQRIQARWDAQPVSSGLRAAVFVNLLVDRTGAVRNVAILQSSGSSEVDFAARRAISDATPLPPFLANCEGNEAKIEVRFQPKR